MENTSLQFLMLYHHGQHACEETRRCGNRNMNRHIRNNFRVSKCGIHCARDTRNTNCYFTCVGLSCLVPNTDNIQICITCNCELNEYFFRHAHAYKLIRCRLQLNALCFDHRGWGFYAWADVFVGWPSTHLALFRAKASTFASRARSCSKLVAHKAALLD